MLQQEWNLAGRSAAASDKLRNLDYPEAEVERLRRGERPRAVSIPSSVAGTMIDKIAVEGARFRAGDALFHIVDTTNMWVMAEVYEQDLAFVKVGDTARVTVNAWPDRAFDGRVAFAQVRCLEVLSLSEALDRTRAYGAMAVRRVWVDVPNDRRSGPRACRSARQEGPIPLWGQFTGRWQQQPWQHGMQWCSSFRRVSRHCRVDMSFRCDRRTTHSPAPAQLHPQRVFRSGKRH